VTRNEQLRTISFTQTHLIQSILDDLDLTEKSNHSEIPALSSKMMQKFEASPAHTEDWHYQSVIGKLQYFEKSTRPDLAYAVHQCARFSENPRLDHSKAVKFIGRYLLGTKEQGLHMSPKDESFIDWSDANFSGNWDHPTAEMTPYSQIKIWMCSVLRWMSRSFYSKLQTEIALSSTESEYLAL
jgi:hypothetical protein